MISRTVGILMIFLVTTAAAQPPFSMGQHHPMERLEQLKKVRLIEMLDLKEEQSVRFFARLNEHDDAKRTLLEQKNEVLDKIERLIRNHAEEEEYTTIFPDVREINRQIVEEDWKFFSSLKDILSTEQMGKYLLFERQFERELREAMRDIQRRRFRRGGGQE